MIAQGERIALRLPVLSDIPEMELWENIDHAIESGNSTHSGISVAELKKFILRGNDFLSQGQLRLMITDNYGKNLGILDFFHHNPIKKSCEIGILIAPEANRRHGFATDALNEGLNYAFRVFGIVLFLAKVKKDNQASLRLFEKSGFIAEITDEEIVDYKKGY